jgi:adenosylcobinamide-GDP ribazoletransferase
VTEPNPKKPLWLPEALLNPLAGFLAALRFLTIVPLSWGRAEDGRYFAASLPWFPVIGLLIGLAIAVILLLLTPFFPQPVLAFMAIVLLAAASGCLHLDGLADSGDGLLSARPRERILEIMRDSHIGAMGVITLILMLLGKYAALSCLDDSFFLITLIIMPVAGRCAILVTMAVLPYAREGEGLGRCFYSPATRIAALGAILFWTATVAAASFFLLDSRQITLALFLLVAPGCTLASFALWCHAKIGGATGDTLGAICELSELMTAVAMTMICFTAPII